MHSRRPAFTAKLSMKFEKVRPQDQCHDDELWKKRARSESISRHRATGTFQSSRRVGSSLTGTSCSAFMKGK